MDHSLSPFKPSLTPLLARECLQTITKSFQKLAAKYQGLGCLFSVTGLSEVLQNEVIRDGVSIMKQGWETAVVDMLPLYGLLGCGPGDLCPRV